MQFTYTSLVAILALFSVLATPVFAVGTDDGSSATSQTAAAYDEAKAMVEAGNFTSALAALLAITSDDPLNADAWNLLGFTHRKLGQFDESSAAYLKVLGINPDHLGALEYQGELFLQTGKPELAKANLTRLKGLCGDCEAFEDLEKAIQQAGV